MAAASPPAQEMEAEQLLSILLLMCGTFQQPEQDDICMSETAYNHSSAMPKDSCPCAALGDLQRQAASATRQDPSATSLLRRALAKLIAVHATVNLASPAILCQKEHCICLKGIPWHRQLSRPALLPKWAGAEDWKAVAK